MQEVIFTGFPGFIASQLIRRHAQGNSRVTAIVLKSEWEKAQHETRRIEQETGTTVHLIEGDIKQKDLGISLTERKRMAENESVFWHLAAIYDLAVPRAIAWKVNVEGTRHVLEFLTRLPRVKRFMYFSTAYVAGLRTGRLYEDELIRPDRFKNYYEETKYEAEVLVEACKTEVPTTIIRPGIVRGHSVTGETIKFDGPYFLLNMIDRLEMLPFLPYIGRTAEFLNVVPVDYVLEAALFLSSLPRAEGETVHLTDPSPHPVEEIYRAMVFEMTGQPPKGRVPKRVAELGLRLPAVRKFLHVEAETLDYFEWEASFDATNAQRLLEGSGIRCADFLETLPAMVRFYKQHKNDTSKQIPIS